MIFVVITKLLLLYITCASGREVCCSNGDCYDDSPPFDSRLIPLPMCPEDMDPIFLLFTRKNNNTPEEFDRFTIPSNFEGHKNTAFIVHGYNNDHTKGWIERTRLGLLKREDVNVVVVGWEKGASSANYFKTVSNSRVIATETVYVMENLYRAGASPDRMWCIGHSLGAHACGRMGKISKFSRITGLDPAGPAWDNLDFTAGLTKNDAHFVDTIHSHGQGLAPWGTMLARGHVDFYPNDGAIQPGCVTYDTMAMLNNIVRNGHHLPLLSWTQDDFDINCSHGRAKEYFIESLAEPCFRATQKCTDFKNIPESCSACTNCPYMGYDTPTSAPHGLYNLPTAASEPWCIQ